MASKGQPEPSLDQPPLDRDAQIAKLIRTMAGRGDFRGMYTLLQRRARHAPGIWNKILEQQGSSSKSKRNVIGKLMGKLNKSTKSGLMRRRLSFRSIKKQPKDSSEEGSGVPIDKVATKYKLCLLVALTHNATPPTPANYKEGSLRKSVATFLQSFASSADSDSRKKLLAEAGWAGAIRGIMEPAVRGKHLREHARQGLTYKVRGNLEGWGLASLFEGDINPSAFINLDGDAREDDNPGHWALCDHGSAFKQAYRSWEYLGNSSSHHKQGRNDYEIILTMLDSYKADRGDTRLPFLGERHSAKSMVHGLRRRNSSMGKSHHKAKTKFSNLCSPSPRTRSRRRKRPQSGNYSGSNGSLGSDGEVSGTRTSTGEPMRAPERAHTKHGVLRNYKGKDIAKKPKGGFWGSIIDCILR